MNDARILIVEDSRIVGEDIKQKLVSMGYTVSGVVTSGRKALEEAEQNPPHIAIMDIKLGEGIDGIDTAARLREKYHIPVIYLTAFADQETIKCAKKTEPLGYLVKPFDDKGLHSAVEIALYKLQMENKLRASEQWLETTLNSIGDGVIAVDLDGNLNFMNPVAEELTGWSISDVAGKPIRDVFRIINEHTRQVVANPIEKVFAVGQIVGLANSTLLIAKDGREIPIADSGAPIVNKKGEIIGAVLVFRDQTKERMAQKSIEERERKLSTLMGNLPGMAYRCLNDQDWTMLFLSNGCEVLTGYKPEELLTNRILTYKELIVPEDRQYVRNKVQAAVASNRSFTLEYRIVDKPGNTKWVWEKGIAFQEDENGPVILEGFISDITEKKFAEKELLVQKQKAERYLNLAGVMFVGIDAEGNVNIANEKACKILECSKTEIIGHNWFDNYIPQNIRNEVRGVFNQLILGNLEPVEYYENPVISKSGREKYIAWHNTFIRNGEGQIVGVLGAGEDITEKKRLRAQLQQAQKMESIGTLAGGIAHDFNNILASVIGYTELGLDDAVKGSAIENSLQEIYTAGKRARDLVKQILAFARQSEETKKPISVGTMVKEVLKFIRSSIPATMEIKQNIESNSLIIGNDTQVHQILMNLCTNAVHAMEETGGILSFSVKDVSFDMNPVEKNKGLKPGDYIEVRVSDTGVGIAPDIINSIFEPYFTTKDPGKGTGMGLAMVHGVVESYGGKIMVDSTLGKGTTVRVYLPVTEKRKVHGEYKIEPLPVGTERILLVDDEVPVTKMGGRILSRLGYFVTTRTSSIEALELFRAKPDDFDLVVTDMTMPNMTGDRLATEMMKIRPDIPVILCTGYSNQMSDEIASEIGIKAFAYKPIVKTDLAKIVRKVLDGTKSVRHQG